MSCSTPEKTAKSCEPMERVLIDVPEDCVGSVMEKLGARKGELVHMAPSRQPDAH